MVEDNSFKTDTLKILNEMIDKGSRPAQLRKDESERLGALFNTLAEREKTRRERASQSPPRFTATPRSEFGEVSQSAANAATLPKEPNDVFVNTHIQNPWCPLPSGPSDHDDHMSNGSNFISDIGLSPGVMMSLVGQIDHDDFVAYSTRGWLWETDRPM